MLYYLDENNQKCTLRDRTKVTLGIRKLRGTDHIIGIVISTRIRPIYNEDNRMFVVKMDDLAPYVLQTTNGVPYGLEPEHTVEGIVILSRPRTPPRQSQEPSSSSSG